jgi:hypothetical protein
MRKYVFGGDPGILSQAVNRCSLPLPRSAELIKWLLILHHVNYSVLITRTLA